eukprot:10156700-Ditylum_brightwellii.AAC.1
MRPDMNRGLEVCLGASFTGEWDNENSEEPTSVLSRTGYSIKYSNCTIVWTSKLQTEITLSTTEAEYVTLSQATREIIPLIHLLNEIKGSIKSTTESRPEFKCTVFEDNLGCIELAKCPRMRPRTKHIAIKYYHFRSMALDETISVTDINTDEQWADLQAKNLDKTKFLKFRKLICGW